MASGVGGPSTPSERNTTVPTFAAGCAPAGCGTAARLRTRVAIATTPLALMVASLQNPVNSSSPMNRAITSISQSVIPMASALAAAAVGSKEYLR